MYSIKVESSDESKPVIDRSMSSDTAKETIPIIIEICRSQFSMVNPWPLYMGDDVYRIVDMDNPSIYVQVSIIRNYN